MTQEEMRARLATAQAQQPPDPREEMERAIQSHYEKVQQFPDDPEAPALYLAMGNLHRRLFNYEEAIWAYQQIFVRYPDWDGLPMVYGELASCYEESGDHDNMLRIYMEMMRVFPEESREYRFAQGKLGL
jgi:tetratricopeptide (TPR) repeat protein